ncbi:MAG: hypothetical protein WA364_27760, partial [Candidatus Nitrosopolaris sp.]
VNGFEVFYISTEASDKGLADHLTNITHSRVSFAPALKNARPQSLANNYVFQNGIKGYRECPRNINGDNVKNIVNRLSTNALQIEQTTEVRDKSKLRLIVADAVVKVIGSKITV